jgi:hypothetical protein
LSKEEMVKLTSNVKSSRHVVAFLENAGISSGSVGGKNFLELNYMSSTVQC